jgi:ABC-type multidrug transport system permease subunit
MSSAMLPKAFLPQWVQDFSLINPVSYLADAARTLILTGYDWDAIGKAFLSIAVLGLILNLMAVQAFRAQGR